MKPVSLSAVAGVLLTTAAIAADGAGPAFAPEQARAANALIDRALKDDVAWTFVEGLTTEIGPRLAGS
ncbi:MAG: peptidase M28 family protein, partial [Alphaproteobacteria bacterium]|nr:peptidase M28 family protein [Alphaproteobacteria bacterium]